MSTELNILIPLTKNITNITADIVSFSLELDIENISSVKHFLGNDFIERIITIPGNEIVSEDNISKNLNQNIEINFVINELNNIGYYLKFDEFVERNRIESPDNFYIQETDYLNNSNKKNISIEKYNAITNLIKLYISLIKFQTNEHYTIFLFNEKEFIEIELDNLVYEDYLTDKNIEIVNNYILEVSESTEKRAIYIKGLIDYLTEIKLQNRFKELIINFEEYYNTCQISYEFYLSNYSYNKIKIELDNATLEYSKNIRNVINDSQTKLIAIPVAFVLAISQIDQNIPFSYKNLSVLFSLSIFAYLIRIFLKNQENALQIINDNLANYKSYFKSSKKTDLTNENDKINLNKSVDYAFSKIETELKVQKNRLNHLNFINILIPLLTLTTLICNHYKKSITHIFNNISNYFGI